MSFTTWPFCFKNDYYFQDFNYEIDSDDEWEEEPGESLHGSDDEKEPEEDYEVDNDFFVPHGYLSDDEAPEKENMVKIIFNSSATKWAQGFSFLNFECSFY